MSLDILEPFDVERLDGRRLPWSKSRLDEVARAGNSCAVKHTLADSGPGAILAARIEIVADNCESGLPHTTDANTIRMTESVWNSPRRDNILAHERVHLEQRRAPDAWKDFYTKAWNYRIQTSPPSSLPLKEIADRIRGNPDIHPERWACWGDRYWFVTVYTDAATPHLTGAQTRVWDEKTGQWLSEAPDTWRATFCLPTGECPHQWEHPHELAAEIWTDIERWTTPAAVALRNFMSVKN
jgi:hypothetical protein